MEEKLKGKVNIRNGSQRVKLVELSLKIKKTFGNKRKLKDFQRRKNKKCREINKLF